MKDIASGAAGGALLILGVHFAGRTELGYVASAAVHLIWATRVLRGDPGLGALLSWVGSFVLCALGLHNAARNHPLSGAAAIEGFASFALWSAGPRPPLAALIARNRHALLAAGRAAYGERLPQLPRAIHEHVRTRAAEIAGDSARRRSRGDAQTQTAVLEAVAEMCQMCAELDLPPDEKDRLARECESYLLSVAREDTR